MKAATVAPEGTPWSALMDRIKARTLKRSQQTYKFKVYYGGRLGGEKETLRETKKGRIHLWGGSMAALATMVPELYALETPYLFASVEEADFVLDRYVRPEVDKLLAQRGFVLYQFAENGWHGIGLRDRCVTGPKSLEGIKIRAQEAAVYLDTLRAMGANPIEMGVPEVLPALKQGTVDGFTNTPLFAFATSWYQGVKFFTPTRHVYQPAIIVYSKVWFDAQPKPIQTILMSEVQADQEFGRKAVRQIREALLDNFTRAKIEVCPTPKPMLEEFRRVTRGVFKKYEKRAGKRGAGLYRAIARGKKAFAAQKPKP